VRRGTEDQQWHTREDIKMAALTRLRHVLIDAGAHVPYRRYLFDVLAFEPTEVLSLGDLRRLPLLTKSQIRRTPRR